MSMYLFNILALITLEVALRRCFAKEGFLKVLQNSRESNCAVFKFLIKLQADKFLKIHKKRPVLESRF